MRFAINILTPLTAFCLFVTAYDCPAQEKHFDQRIVQKATKAENQSARLFLTRLAGSRN